MVRPDTSPLYLSLRNRHGEATVVVAVDVDASSFFSLRDTQIVTMPAAGKDLEGRTYQSLGEAATRVRRVMPGGSTLGDYLAAFEAYCTGELGQMFHDARARGIQAPSCVGTAVRTLGPKRGQQLSSKYSPELCCWPLTTRRSEDGTGEWVGIGLLLPMVPRSMPPDDAIAELRRIESGGRQNQQVSIKQEEGPTYQQTYFRDAPDDRSDTQSTSSGVPPCQEGVMSTCVRGIQRRIASSSRCWPHLGPAGPKSSRGSRAAPSLPSETGGNALTRGKNWQSSAARPRIVASNAASPSVGTFASRG